MAAAMKTSSEYDRTKEMREFDETKAGVKGLTDSGIKKIPRIFIHDPENLPNPSDFHDPDLKLPVIDFQDISDPNRRQEIVAEVCQAAKSWGFFQLLNHGIPLEVLDGMLQATRRFHELDVDVKAKFHSSDMTKKVRYFSIYDLNTSRAVDWRDTLGFIFEAGPLDSEELPSVCRAETLDFKQYGMAVAETLFELLSEALGLEPCYLKSINSTNLQTIICHYYPPCLEPNLTLGTSMHADPDTLTLLLQDGLGGLQVLHQNQWIPVSPIPGALIVNIGDLLQLISNDKFKSVQHRVLASCEGPRISVAMFFRPNIEDERPYGPIKELLSDKNPPVYNEILVKDYLMHFIGNGYDGESALNPLKLQ